jgi:hypothetical protein
MTKAKVSPRSLHRPNAVGVALGFVVWFALGLLGGVAEAGADHAVASSGILPPRRAIDAAPGVAVGLLRRTASAEFSALFDSLRVTEKRSFAGAYVAFDDSPIDIGSMVGCDDDGDYVVVVTDALLAFATFVAHAEATDETFGTHKVDEYATFLAEAPRSGAWKAGVRPVPPPLGFFDASQGLPAAGVKLEVERFREIVGAILAHELTHFVQGNLMCPHPTATHERGDDEWTPDERERSLASALDGYTAESVLSADREATVRLLESGLTEQGSLAWLRTVGSIERAMEESPLCQDASYVPTYLRLHKNSEARAEVIRSAAREWRQTRVQTRAAPSSAPTEPPLSPPKRPTRGLKSKH